MTMTAAVPILRAEGISKNYGSKAILKEVSLALDRGEVKVLIGPSGAGKSTLLQCLNLLVMPDAGRIWLEGREVDRSRRKGLHGYRRQVGIIFLVGDLLPFRGVARAGALLLAPDSEKRARLWDVRKEVSLRIKEKTRSTSRKMWWCRWPGSPNSSAASLNSNDVLRSLFTPSAMPATAISIST